MAGKGTGKRHERRLAASALPDAAKGAFTHLEPLTDRLLGPSALPVTLSPKARVQIMARFATKARLL
jgi:hypothetical protein